MSKAKWKLEFLKQQFHLINSKYTEFIIAIYSSHFLNKNLYYFNDWIKNE